MLRNGPVLLTRDSEEMDGKPDRWFIFRRPRYPMPAAGRDQQMVAGTEIALTIPVDP